MSTSQEFAIHRPAPQRGLTSVEAAQYLRNEFPDIAVWLLWVPDTSYLSQLVAPGAGSGSIGEWKWERVHCSYPRMTYWEQRLVDTRRDNNWVGIVRVMGPEKEPFLLFSCLASTGTVGEDRYYVSTTDRVVLQRFAQAVENHFNGLNRDKARINFLNGPDICLTVETKERLFLAPGMKEDIEGQALPFFESADMYRKLDIPYRRGLLFVGMPGCGKTMMVRHLVRECHKRRPTSFFSLRITRGTDEDDVGMLFARAGRQAPAMIILEDMDSLVNEARVSRSFLLGQMDGLEPKEGLLILATTNNPGDVDPALLDRPSRFDRVWLFEPPGFDLRHAYLAYALKGIDAHTVESLARRTDGWSFAYLNEMRVTASLFALKDKRTELNRDDATEACDVLATQFRSAKKNHRVEHRSRPVGFGDDAGE